MDAAHRPPIAMHGLHARYANATYTAASKQSILPKVEEELAAIKLTASKSPSFQAFLDNPLISRNDKEEGFQRHLQPPHNACRECEATIDGQDYRYLCRID